MLWVLLTNPRAVLDASFELPQVEAALGLWGSHSDSPLTGGGWLWPCIMVGPHGGGAPRPREGQGN